ncbi:hypothetical protein F8154_05400 [Alkaliphilus pronyensis]|uniref:Uncharacterized protein n=1 Tax=Alkaliphilus pronyensis TaxID=1482732 RepID=A0A6I0FB17_9FIRM|nr:hypothetical protein [Alkaliphilus pronyensis]KAB3535736.1 hypothetical protein F8154_05400 [Alkaliphilus pronyensis]
MEKKLLSKHIKNIIVLAVVCGISWLLLYIIGHFTVLHPNAYFDITKSIFLVYVVYLVVGSLYKVFHNIKNFDGIWRKFSLWWGNETPFEAICESFTIVTAINSIMMLTGHDTPKEGVFAYIHMMLRLLIISSIITIWMWKDILQWVKKSTFRFNIKSLYQLSKKHFFASISKLFTIITTVYCILVIAFYRILNPAGGIAFYQTLLGILAFTVLFMFVHPARRG